MLQAFYNLTIRAKLFVAFALVILLNLGVTLTAIVSISLGQSVSNEIEDLTDTYMSKNLVDLSTVIEIDSMFIAGLNEIDSNVSLDALRMQFPAYERRLQDIANSPIPDIFANTSIDPNSRELADLKTKYMDSMRNNRASVKAVADSVRKMDNLITQAQTREDMILALETYLRDVHVHTSEVLNSITNVIIVESDYATMLADENANPKTMYTVISLAIAAFVLAICFAMFLSNYIGRSLDMQVNALKDLSQGYFNKPLNAQSKDEFGKSIRMLDNMRASINDVLKTINQSCDGVQDEMNNLRSFSDKIANSSAEVQTQSVTIAAAANEMVSTTADIARNCESAATSANDCQNMTDESLAQVQQSMDGIRRQAERTKDNASKVESLAQQTNKISSIVSTIDEIAAQTNLLALNAAIEAARAGEAGRGFAVVADEVRALASRTTASTKEISDMIKTVQTEARGATDAISGSVGDMDDLAHNAQGIMTVLNEVGSHVKSVTTQITQIATAAEQQTTATSEISSNMQNVSNSTTDMSNDAQQQMDAMEKSIVELDNLRQALSFFKA